MPPGSMEPRGRQLTRTIVVRIGCESVHCAPQAETCLNRVEALLNAMDAAAKRDTQTTTTRERVESQDGEQKKLGTKTIPTSQPGVRQQSHHKQIFSTHHHYFDLQQ